MEKLSQEQLTVSSRIHHAEVCIHNVFPNLNHIKSVFVSPKLHSGNSSLKLVWNAIMEFLGFSKLSKFPELLQGSHCSLFFRREDPRAFHVKIFPEVILL